MEHEVLSTLAHTVSFRADYSAVRFTTLPDASDHDVGSTEVMGCLCLDVWMDQSMLLVLVR